MRNAECGMRNGGAGSEGQSSTVLACRAEARSAQAGRTYSSTVLEGGGRRAEGGRAKTTIGTTTTTTMGRRRKPRSRNRNRNRSRVERRGGGEAEDYDWDYDYDYDEGEGSSLVIAIVVAILVGLVWRWVRLVEDEGGRIWPR